LRAKIIACETVREELRNLIPPDMPCKFLEFGLHLAPERLHMALQCEIDATQKDVDTILFGYGMCAKGTVGLEARRFRLVIPRVDDCIALCLGSRAEYLRQCRKAPGTFYLTKGWIECGDDPYTEYLKMREKCGHDEAYYLEQIVIQNYTRLVLINMGNYDLDKYRSYAQQQAAFFGLTFEEIPGSRALIKKLVEGNWDEDFVVVEPGGKVEYGMFANFPNPFDELQSAEG
jgi:hypothetical protein